MKKKIFSILFAVVLVLTLSLVTAAPVAAAAIDVYPGDSIQAAVDEASPGDTIIVHPGTYDETIDVNKSLTICSSSDDPSDTVIAADVENEPVFKVSEVEHVNIEGFTIKAAIVDAWGCVAPGVYLYKANNITVSNNIIESISSPNLNAYGIYLKGGSNCVISGNIIRDISAYQWAYGIYVLSSDDNVIKFNSISDLKGANDIGINLCSSDNNMLGSNDISDLKPTLRSVRGIYLSSSSDYNTLRSNHISNLTSAESNYADTVGIELIESSHNTFKDNSISELTAYRHAIGISLYSWSNHNTFHSTHISKLTSTGTYGYAKGMLVYGWCDNNSFHDTRITELTAEKDAYGIDLNSWANYNAFDSTHISELTAGEGVWGIRLGYHRVTTYRTYWYPADDNTFSFGEISELDADQVCGIYIDSASVSNKIASFECIGLSGDGFVISGNENNVHHNAISENAWDGIAVSGDRNNVHHNVLGGCPRIEIFKFLPHHIVFFNTISYYI